MVNKNVECAISFYILYLWRFTGYFEIHEIGQMNLIDLPLYTFFSIFFDAIFSCILKSLQSSFNSERVPLDFFFSLIVRFLRGAVGLKKKKKLVLQLLLSNLKTSDVILEKMTECCMLPLTLFLFISFVPLDSGDHLCMNLPASSFSQLRPLLAASGMLK